MTVTFDTKIQIEIFKLMWVQGTLYDAVVWSEFSQQLTLLSGFLHIDNHRIDNQFLSFDLMGMKPMLCATLLCGQN